MQMQKMQDSTDADMQMQNSTYDAQTSAHVHDADSGTKLSCPRNFRVFELFEGANYLSANYFKVEGKGARTTQKTMQKKTRADSTFFTDS